MAQRFRSAGCRRFVVPAALSLVAACGPTTPTAPSLASWSALPDHKLPLAVSGRVIDYANKSAVAGAALDWIPAGSNRAQRATTDPTGSYAVSLPVAASYSVSLTTGSTTVAAGLIVPPVALQHQRDFYVNAAGCVLIYGNVFDAVTGLPVSGAQVSYLGSATTNSAGAFLIEPGCGLRFSGTIPVTIRHPAYTFPFTVGGRGESFTPGTILRRDFQLTPVTSPSP